MELMQIVFQIMIILLDFKSSMTKDAFDNTLILTLTKNLDELLNKIVAMEQHGYGSAMFDAGGLVKKAQVHADWPGLTKKNCLKEET